MSLGVRLVVVDARGVAPFAAALGRLERGIAYPIADGADHFHIDHGPAYHPFFSALGDARFVLALRGDDVVGSMAGVLRSARRGDRVLPSAYLCDLKIAPSERGAGLPRRMALRALAEVALDPALRRFRVAYGAAMRGARGDVMRAVRGLHPGRLLRPAARLAVYFTPPALLARLDLRGAPRPPSAPGLDLSPGPSPGCAPAPPEPNGSLDAAPLGLVSTAGRKDLRLASTGAPWPLAHFALGPAAWAPTLAHRLRACGEALAAPAAAPPPTVCFALDVRLADHLAWLEARGVTPGATCTVYTLTLAAPIPRIAWVHLATSEI